MVPTSSGEVDVLDPQPFASPLPVHRADGWFPEGDFLTPGGRRGVHSEDFEPLWRDLTGMYRAYPGTRW